MRGLIRGVCCEESRGSRRIRALMTAKERRAENEALFREVNERIATQGVALGGSFEIICECSDMTCFEHLHVDQRSYERVRQDARLFLVLPGHVDESIERVVQAEEAYVLVRKEHVASADHTAQAPASAQAPTL